MNSIYFVFASLLLIQRSDASFPAAFHGYSPYVPYYGAVAAPSPVVHAAPTYYPYSYPMAYHHPQRELHNVAGAVQRESGLLTDVSIRFPAKKALKNH
ncbi:hypothetical protein Y032_0003g1163 [Ancylostoma ceylanicum]|uniref:Uncharacterized protein n=1 Tax=Ancylostoma ceylanicum TaxID=53326 RepID=A0A016VW63_9BILA|nr:hypothetical protein Y032_0003g1163 [Ancylostoma ceylanicum]